MRGNYMIKKLLLTLSLTISFLYLIFSYQDLIAIKDKINQIQLLITCAESDFHKYNQISELTDILCDKYHINYEIKNESSKKIISFNAEYYSMLANKNIEFFIDYELTIF